uniref:ATP synthase protein 8 n=1 Tax=Graphis scripta TaxID=71600 RepID=A0A4P8DNQ9_9LECA|nr:ATP synthase F0 subunit 8 [Graphis scripta]
MPQLVPFFFINEVLFTFVLLILIIYMFTKYILPKFIRLFTTRILLKKL